MKTLFPKYIPSQELLFFLVTKLVNNSPHLITDILSDKPLLSGISNKFSDDIIGLLTTISKEVKRGKEINYCFTENNKLKEKIINSILLRFNIPIDDKELFQSLLLADLKNLATSSQQVGKHCILNLVNGEILLERTEKIVKNIKSSYIKALLFFPI